MTDAATPMGSVTAKVCGVEVGELMVGEKRSIEVNYRKSRVRLSSCMRAVIWSQLVGSFANFKSIINDRV